MNLSAYGLEGRALTNSIHSNTMKERTRKGGGRTAGNRLVDKTMGAQSDKNSK